MPGFESDPKGPPAVVKIRTIRDKPTKKQRVIAIAQHQLFTPETLPVVDWVAPDPRNLPDLSLLYGTIVGYDLETHDPEIKTKGPGWPWRGGKVVGVSLDWCEIPVYLPFDHEGGDNLDGESQTIARNWLDALHKDQHVTLAMHNAPYDLGWSMRWLGSTPRVCHDTLAMAALLNEYRQSYRLDRVASEELGETKDERILEAASTAMHLDPKSDLWRLPARFVSEYASQDARITRKLALRFAPMIASRELLRVYQLEQDVQQVLIAMRAKGIRVDVDRARLDYHRLRDQMKQLQKKHLPIEVNVWSGTLGTWLGKNGYVLPKTEAGAPSVTKDWLKAGAKHDERLAAILKIRQLDKLTETFIKAYLLDKEVGGRIYPEFHPLRSDEGGAVTGRFSSSHPNFQNLSAVKNADDPDDAGRLVRGYILPEEGDQWVAIDYSQQEPRLAVHFASTLRLTGAAALRDRYLTDPRTDFYSVVSEGAGLERKQAKVISLGRMYGMGDAKMCISMGFPTARDANSGILTAGAEGRQVIDAFDKASPWMRELSQRVGRTAERRGWIWTLGGRRCRFKHDESGEPIMEGNRPVPVHKFLNRLIQGSAADQTKSAMVAVHRAGLVDALRVTVHDELGFSMRDTSEMDAAQSAMLGCVTLHVPSAVDREVGPSWGAAR